MVKSRYSRRPAGARRRGEIFALKAACLGGLGLAMAAGAAGAGEPITVFGYAFSITVQGATASAYQGSKHYSGFPSVSVFPVLPADYDAFGAPDDSPSVAVFSTSTFAVGPAVSFIPDRGNSHALRGMEKIGAAGEAGGFINWWPQPWMRVRVEALKGVFSEDGLLVNTASDFLTHKGRFTLSTGPRFAWSDSRYNGTYFGVTPAEAADSRNFHTAYAPGSGPLSAGWEGALEYKWRDRWRFDLSANYDRLLGPAADSPLVRVTGSPNQYSVAGGVRFMLSR